MTQDLHRDAERFDQLEQWLTQGKTPTDISDPEMAELLQISQMLSEEKPLIEIPRPKDFHHQLFSKLSKRRFPRYLVGALAAAACLFLAFLFMQKQTPVEGPDGPQIVLDENLLRHALQKQTTQSMLDYLNDTEHLLLAMRDFDVHCSEDQLDLAAEKERAQDLLLKQKLFSTQMNRPQYLHARQLFDQLERILVDLNSMELCTDSGEIDFINQHVNKNRILSKLRLVAQEFQVS